MGNVDLRAEAVSDRSLQDGASVKRAGRSTESLAIIVADRHSGCEPWKVSSSWRGLHLPALAKGGRPSAQVLCPRRGFEVDDLCVGRMRSPGTCQERVGFYG